MPVIAVIGEALIDLTVDAEGKVAARPGGGPYNTARTLARLGVPAAFLGRLADDGFGHLLRDRLTADGARPGVPQLSGRPSTLAIATIDPAGAAQYVFYLSGTAAADLEYPALAAAVPHNVAAVHVGTLGLAMEPIGSAIERLVCSGLSARVLVMVDPNCRPAAIADRQAYLDRMGRLLSRADVVKASTEDLGYLAPDVPPFAAAESMLGHGPAVVLVTDGPRSARAFIPGDEIVVQVPEVSVVDTIGAGDAFGGAFAAWWTACGYSRTDLRRPALIREALQAAADVASLTCTRAGAEPPTLAEVQALRDWP